MGARRDLPRIAQGLASRCLRPPVIPRCRELQSKSASCVSRVEWLKLESVGVGGGGGRRASLLPKCSHPQGQVRSGQVRSGSDRPYGENASAGRSAPMGLGTVFGYHVSKFTKKLRVS